MAYNLGDIRVSRREEALVGRKPYVDVARAYYNSSMYDKHLGVIANIFDETIPVFNAVPKVTNIASALAVGGNIEPSYSDMGWVSDTISGLALEQEKLFMCRDLILSKSILCEIQKIDRDDSSEVFENEDSSFPYVLAYYPSDEYEIMSEGNRILYAKIRGIQLVLNSDGDGYSEQPVQKVYIRGDDGKAITYIVANGQKTEIEECEGGILPLVEITTTYDMKQLFYAIDRYNELESFSRNILFLAGEPMLVGTGIDKIDKKKAQKMQADQYKKLKSLFTNQKEAELKLIEIKGDSAKTMLERQKHLVESIIKDYPEYSISEVLSGSNVSEETTKIRLTEILSRVNEVRRNMNIGLNKILGIIAFLDGKEVKKKYVTLGTMTDVNLQEILPNIVSALENNIISRKSAMYQIRTLFIGEDVDFEIKQMQDEGIIDKNLSVVNSNYIDDGTTNDGGNE